LQAVRGQVEAGELRLIAVSTPERWPSLPGVPTLAESGLAGFGYSGWYGLVFPVGTPKAIVERVHKVLGQELAREDVQKKLEGAGASVKLSAPAELSQMIERDIASFKTAASKAGIEPK
jgi:tripartite-type tricarboxylate transporter receptor subunit TctC